MGPVDSCRPRFSNAGVEKWCFLQLHAGIFGVHRNFSVTLALLVQLVYWPTMKTDVKRWVDDCLTCIRFRKRPTKQEQVAVKPTNYHPWEEVMIDCEGASQPPDAHGNQYTLTYYCCLCHGVLLEPMLNLSAREVRRAFARCIFRSGTIPKMLRSDRGPEFANSLMQEYVAVVGIRHRFGAPWRPVEQGGVERVHQEM